MRWFLFCVASRRRASICAGRSGDLRPDDWNSVPHVTPHVSIPSAARAVDVAPSVKALGIGVKTCRAQPLHGKFVCYGCCLHVAREVARELAEAPHGAVNSANYAEGIGPWGGDGHDQDRSNRGSRDFRFHYDGSTVTLHTSTPLRSSFGKRSVFVCRGDMKNT